MKYEMKVKLGFASRGLSLSRWMLARCVAWGACASMLVAAGCSRFDDSKLVGTWRGEDEASIEELTLNQDHSFRSVGSYKQILATPSIPTEIGTWQRQGNQLAFDATLTFDKTKRQFKRTLSEVTRTTLVLREVRNGKTLKYGRFNPPPCSGSVVDPGHGIDEGQLIGLWQLHYNTHDYRFRLMSNRRYELLGLIDGKWDLLNHPGSWRLDGTRLTWQPDKKPYSDDQVQTWTIILKGTDCLAMSDGHCPATVFRRVE